jgi:hypothetical protein
MTKPEDLPPDLGVTRTKPDHPGKPDVEPLEETSPPQGPPPPPPPPHPSPPQVPGG